MFKFSFLLVVALAIASVSGFVVPSSSNNVVGRHSKNSVSSGPMSSSALMERQWNFNEGRGPFGMKKNAEIWNGRVAQMGFVVVLLQELVTGKGVIAAFQDGDFVSYAMFGFTAFSVLGLTAFLASKGRESDIIY